MGFEEMEHATGDEIDRYLLGQLDKPELDTVESHLLGCAECRGKFHLTGERILALRRSRIWQPIKWPPNKFT